MKVCVEDGCDGKHVARGYCANHYDLYKRNGKFKDLRPKNRKGCIVEDCDVEKHYSRGYCNKHYNAFMRWGESLEPPPKPDCKCGEPASAARGMCKRCYSNDWYHNAKITPRPHLRKQDIGYEGMHYRVKADRGKASEYQCFDCDLPAEEWSLNVMNNAIFSTHGGRISSLYSMNIDDYEPRCKKCHIMHDTEFRDGQGYRNLH